MQFKVPQNVQREDKIVGPLTLKQMIVMAIGGTIGYAIYISLAPYYIWITWLPPVAIVTIITIAFAFVKPLDLSFTKWVLRWVEFSLLPRSRTWRKTPVSHIMTASVKSQKQKTKKEEAKEKVDAMNEKQKKLERLNEFLESEKKNNKK